MGKALSLPGDDKLPLDALGRPNRTYMGHTSECIPTPWPHEGRVIPYGDTLRRFPLIKDRTKEQEAERIRLAAIENPGRCQARRRHFDGWCAMIPPPGNVVCKHHGGNTKAQKARAEATRNMSKTSKRAMELLKSVQDGKK